MGGKAECCHSPAAAISPINLLIRAGTMPHPEPRWLDEAARVHRPGWRHSGYLAAPGTRATAGKAVDHRFSGCVYGCRVKASNRIFFAPSARTRLDRGPYRYDRVSLGEGTQRALCRNRRRIRAAAGKRHRHGRRCGVRSEGGDIGHPDRIPSCGGPARQRVRGEPRPAGRQYHGTV